mgnify:CR=1 FL=1
MSLDDGLGSNHILVSLHIKKPSGIKTKRSASRELASQKNANDKRVKVTVETFKDGLSELEGHRQMTRSDFDRRSLNWGDDGKRLWHVPEWDKFRPKMEEYKAENYAHYKKFLRGYEEIKNDAQRPAPYGLGDLYDETDWKSVEWLESRWMFEWDICPVPRPESDVRSGWGPQHVERMKREFEEQNQRKIVNAQKDVFGRLEGVLARYSKLDEYNGTAKGRFTDSIADNTRELANILPGFNFNNDPEIEDICARITRELCPIGAQTLRDSESIRMKAKKTADELRQRIGSFGK